MFFFSYFVCAMFLTNMEGGGGRGEIGGRGIWIHACCEHKNGHLIQTMPALNIGLIKGSTAKAES